MLKSTFYNAGLNPAHIKLNSNRLTKYYKIFKTFFFFSPHNKSAIWRRVNSHWDLNSKICRCSTVIFFLSGSAMSVFFSLVPWDNYRANCLPFFNQLCGGLIILEPSRQMPLWFCMQSLLLAFSLLQCFWLPGVHTHIKHFPNHEKSVWFASLITMQSLYNDSYRYKETFLTIALFLHNLLLLSIILQLTSTVSTLFHLLYLWLFAFLVRG